MARLIDAIGDAVDTPEAAWDALAAHKIARLACMLLGLGAFSRLVTIIMDVHRLAMGSPFDERTTWFLVGTLDRGSIWHSIVISACGLALILVACVVTALAITRHDHGKYPAILAELLAATTIRLPAIAGVTMIALFLAGAVYIVESTVSLCIWIGGFALAVLETWRASSKVAARHGARPRVGFLVSLLSSLLMAAVAVGIIYVLGGFD